MVHGLLTPRCQQPPRTMAPPDTPPEEAACNTLTAMP